MPPRTKQTPEQVQEAMLARQAEKGRGHAPAVEREPVAIADRKNRDLSRGGFPLPVRPVPPKGFGQR